MPENNISNVLKQLRKTSGASATDVVTRLKNYSIEISAKTLYGYESGLSMPNADVFVALCRIYNCDNPMDILGNSSIDPTDVNLLKKYHDLDPHGREMVDFVLDKEHARITAAKVIPLSRPILNAAHERTDIEVTDEMRRHDDDLMKNDKLWE